MLSSKNINTACLAYSLALPLRSSQFLHTTSTCVSASRSRPFSPHSQSRAPVATAAQSNRSPANPQQDQTTKTTQQQSPASPLFQCPVCQTPLPPVPELQLHTLPSSCNTCTNPFQKRDGYVDLTPTRTTASTPVDDPPLPLKILRNVVTQNPGQSLFQLPWISYAYERGWRANFAVAGFPGIEKELDILLDFVLPADTILDMSCGSGLMSRRLATSGEFRRVVAADYSDTMLRETVAQARADVTVPEFDVVRADVARLPFVTDAFDAAHAGAALHCWPNVQDGLAEIYRVLKPGKPFMATTFLKGSMLGRNRRIAENPTIKRLLYSLEDAIPRNVPYRFFEEDELRYLFTAAGFVDVEQIVNKGFIAVKCRKPE